MTDLGLGSGSQVLIRGCLHSICTLVLITLLSLRFYRPFFFLLSFPRPGVFWLHGPVAAQSAGPAQPARTGRQPSPQAQPPSPASWPSPPAQPHSPAA